MGNIQFDDLEDLNTFMRRAEETALAQCAEEQLSLGAGDYWYRPYEDTIIFGRVPSIAEVLAYEKQLGASDEEIQDEMHRLLDAHRRGYRYCKCYSDIVPQGEWGSTHISQMIPLDKEEYDLAEKLGWGYIPSGMPAGWGIL